MKTFLPIVIIVFVLCGNSLAQLSGTKTVGSGGDYETIASAITALNSSGVGSGGVTFNIAAGHTKNITSTISLTATGTSSNPIVFQKSGSGNNPKITRTDYGEKATSAVGGDGDALIKIEGSDYVTFDGIDLLANENAIEYGYMFHKPSGTNGCQNITIKNCTIEMKKNSDYVIGIYIGNGTTSPNGNAGVTVTSNDGKNQNITIISNTIKNVFIGIYSLGYNNSTYYDNNITIGQSGAGNTIQYFGAESSNVPYGIFFLYVNNPTASYNTIISSDQCAYPYGILFNKPTFQNAISGDVIANNNNITLSSSIGTTNYIYNKNGVTSETYSNNTFSSGTISSTSTTYLIYSDNNTSNKTISGNQTSGSFITSGNLYCYYNSNGPFGSGTEAVYNNNFSNIQIGSSSSMTVIYAMGGYYTRNIYNNTFSHLTGGSGNTYAIYSTTSSQSNIYNNAINNITAAGIIRAVYAGGSNINIYLNHIHTINTSGSELIGLYYNGYGTSHLYRNQIYNLSSSAASSVKVYGTYYATNSYSSFDLYIYNNFISDLKAPNSDGTDNAVAGIYFSEIGGSNNKFLGIYFNTIFLNASSSGTNFGSAGIYSHSNNNIDLRNNIVINNSTPSGSYKTTALRRSGTDLSTYSTNSNSNCFYAGTPGANNLIYYDGTNSDQSITDFKNRVTPRDEYSFSETPPFINSSSTPYNLHISSGTATRVESGGVPINTPITISNDFDDNARHNYYPDVGADEGNFTLLDENPPYISYESMGTGGNGSTRIFRDVIIVDPSNVNTTSGTAPRVYYKKSTNANGYVGNTSTDNGWKWVEGSLNEGVFNFTIDYTKLTDGGVSPGDVIQYFVVAQDLASTPHIKINSGIFDSPPTSVNLGSSAFPITGTINNYNILQSVSGEILVGFGQTYTSLTANSSSGLFKAINDRVVTGNITAKITSDIEETGEVALNESLEEVLYTISIQPKDANSRVIHGNSVNGLITFNGADKVTIDGSYGSDKYLLLFRNRNNSAPVLTFKNGASQNTIKSVVVEGGSSSAYNGTIFFSSGNNENNIIQDCFIGNVNNDLRSRYGIYFGNSTNSNNTITGNTIYDFLSAGIYLYSLNGGLIEKNEILLELASTFTNVNGILISDPGTEVLTISKNKIHSLNGTASSEIKGIYLSNSFSSGKISIENNSIILSPTTTGTVDGIDIAMYTNNYINLYYNSIYIGGSLTSGSSKSYSLRKREEVGTLSIKNNVFYNCRYNNGGSGAHYSIYLSNTTGVLNSNYNDFYVNGIGTVLSYWLNSDKYTLADWQTASGQDANSINQYPKFLSETSLKPLSGSPLASAGTPVTGITTDIENVSRNGSTPTIGAYENTVSEAALDWCNLHDPANASRLEGEGLTVYARVYKDGVTNGSGQGAGITCWIGYSSLNTNPNTWTNWKSATYNGDAENNRDVYTAWIGANLAPGTYYYASRFLIENGQYQYGGLSTDGGGFWNGTSYVSGVLTVETNNIPIITLIPPVTPPEYPSVKRRNSTEFKGRVEVTQVTTKEFESPAITMHFVYNTTDTPPSTWPSSNKIEAEFVQKVDNKHEYTGDVGSELQVGTYYVATKATLPSGTTQYGGHSSSGGGIWNGTTNVSTRLDITENSSSEPNSNNTIHPPITPNNLNAATKVNNTVFAVGDYGTFVKSTDGGTTFSTKHKIDGFNGRLYGLDFSSESVGYTCGVDSYGNGVIGKTTNGGENWWIGEPVDGSGNKFATGSPVSSIISDEEMGKVIAFLELNQADGFKCFESTNGGTSFIDKSETYPDIDINKARKFGTNDLWAVGNGGIVSYQSGSGTWGGPSSTGAPSNVNFKDIAKNSSGKLVAIGSGKIYVSLDGGWSWQEKLNVGSELVSVKFFADSDSRICVVGQDGVGLYSIDGGETWGYSSWVDVFNPNTLNVIVDKDENNALIVGDAGTIAKTTNGGETFSNVQTRAFNGNNYSIQSPGENNLIVANDDGLYKSTNQGSNWNKINLPSSFSGKMTDIKMVTSLIGFAVSPEGNTILKTTDGGNTWNILRQDNQNIKLESLHVIDQNKVIAWGSDNINNVMLVSTDQGATWKQESAGLSLGGNELVSLTDNKDGKLFAIVRTGSIGAFGFTSNYQLLVSTDNGSNWDENHSNGIIQTLDVNFSNATNGIMVGEGVQFTTDGGNNWTEASIPTNNSLTKVEFLSTNVAVANDDKGGVFWTSDGGRNWKQMESNTNKEIKDVHPINSGSLLKPLNGTVTGYFVGNDGLVIKSTDELLPVELLTLFTSIKNNSVTLFWETATEVDNYGFEVARCENSNVKGETWQTVGFVQGHGNSNSVKSYSFTDKNLKSGKYLYRLKMIDTDGSFEYSNEVEVDVTLPTEFTLMQNYPNPFNAQTKIKFTIPPGANNNKVTLKLFNILGEEIKTLLNEELEAGFHEVDFNASNLASGVFIYRIEWDDKFKVKKMMMIK